MSALRAIPNTATICAAPAVENREVKCELLFALELLGKGNYLDSMGSLDVLMIIIYEHVLIS